MPPTLNGVFPPTQANQWCLEWVDKNRESLDLIARTAAMPMHKLRRRRRRKKINFKKPPTYKSPVPERRKKNK